MFTKQRRAGDLSINDVQRSLLGLSVERTDFGVPNDAVGPLGLTLLHAPPVPLLDIIFVHGLKGGSRKTWSHSPNPLHFWPKEWLPRDPDFKNTRIFSFGYNSDWAESKRSVLTIHDFAKYLVNEIVTSPELSKDSATPIVFVAHSMGGIVVKKACILVMQDKAAITLRKRISAILFLATPHRGADAATVLKRVIQTSIFHKEKPFVAELERNSAQLQSINDEFRHHADNMLLHSFYETIPTNLGYTTALVVNKDSASLGYPNETSSPLGADHRGVCKFENPSHRNFITVRNCLLTICQGIHQKVELEGQIQRKQHLQSLREYLGDPEIQENELSILQDIQHPGSCNWFTDSRTFQTWRDICPSSSPFFCLTGSPAAGKSVIASHIIRSLKKTNTACSYYFFRYNDTIRSNLSTCLRSLVYQWALKDITIQQHLLRLIDDMPLPKTETEQTLWRKLFLETVFEIAIDQPHYFVIDALDECNNPRGFIMMLSKVPAGFPLRILWTSRPDATLRQIIPCVADRLNMQEMSIADTIADITLYLNASVKSLPLYGESIMEDVNQEILQKACGSFLWVSLVIDELRSAYNWADIHQIINELPQSMEFMYSRSLQTLSSATRGENSRKIIQSLLIWIVCAAQPLTTMEIEEAIALELGQDALAIPLDRFIALTCSHLLHVDAHTHKVTARHETVAAFLTKPGLESEFAVDKPSGHAKIAGLCLLYLNKAEMRPPRGPMEMSRYRQKSQKRGPFVVYACLYFSYHLRKSQSEDTSSFAPLFKFLTCNISSWIEHMASSGGIQHLISTSHNLKGYLQARTKYILPTDLRRHKVDCWGTDLIRLVYQFGRTLIKSPHAIFWLIPPFCPAETAIVSSIGSFSPSIKVLGLSATTWDDCISTKLFQDLQPRTITASDATFAVGISDKTMRIFSCSSFQMLHQFSCTEATKLCLYDATGKIVAISTVHFLELYEVSTGTRIWQSKTEHEILAMAFTQKDSTLLTFSKSGNLIRFSVTCGAVISALCLTDPSQDRQDVFVVRRPFTCAAISVEHNMIAAAQRGFPLAIYDLAEEALLATFHGDYNAKTTGDLNHTPLYFCRLAFNPRDEPCFLAALQNDGTLMVTNPYVLEVQAQVMTDGHHVLACSSDGHTLVTGSVSGTIQLYESKTLSILYTLVAEDYSIKSLVFTADSLRLLDIRGSQCNIWEPHVLARITADETNSPSEEFQPGAKLVSTSRNIHGKAITAIACHTDGMSVLCGREDGSVSVYSTVSGQLCSILYRHAKGITITSIHVGRQAKLVASTDVASRVLVWKLIRAGDKLTVEGPILDQHIVDYSISQILISHDESRILVSTLASDTVFKIDGDGLYQTESRSRDSSWKWANHPTDPDKLLHITTASVRLHDWNQISESASSISMIIDAELNPSLEVKNVAVCSKTCLAVVEYANASGQQSTSHTLIFPVTAFHHPLPASIMSLPRFSKLIPDIEHLIGSVDGKAFFLNRDRWICSVDLHSFQSIYNEHCCIPDGWFSANWNLMLTVTARGDFVFAKHTEIVIIRGALALKEPVNLG